MRKKELRRHHVKTCSPYGFDAPFVYCFTESYPLNRMNDSTVTINVLLLEILDIAKGCHSHYVFH